jgi:UDP-glucose 4-epimerase
MNDKALITGAGGAIGLPLLRRLLSRGYQVRALVRQRMHATSLPENVTVITGDIADRSVLDKAVAGVDVIFHLAAKIHINDPSPELKSDYQRVNVEGTRRLAGAARRAGVKRLVLFSTINVYGPSRPGEVLDENSPLHPDSYYAQTKAQAEEIARAELSAVVLRLAAVYGPNMKGNYPRLVDALRRRRFAFVGDGLNRRTLVHVDDVCSAALLAAEHPGAAGRICNVTDGTVPTLRQIVEAMCAALNCDPPWFGVPLSAARCAAGILDGVAGRLLGKRLSFRAAVDKITEDIAVSGSRMTEELGFRPQYHLSRGWQDTVNALYGSRPNHGRFNRRAPNKSREQVSV